MAAIHGVSSSIAIVCLNGCFRGVLEMSETTSFWLIRHAAVDGPKGTIWSLSAPANLGDRDSIDLLRSASASRREGLRKPGATNDRHRESLAA